jgi:hypothetical protein
MDERGGRRSATESGRSCSDVAASHAAFGSTQVPVRVSGGRTGEGQADVDLAGGLHGQIGRGAYGRMRLRGNERRSLFGISRAPAMRTTLRLRRRLKPEGRARARSETADVFMAQPQRRRALTLTDSSGGSRTGLTNPVWCCGTALEVFLLPS